MGQVLRRSATTTEAVRRAIQHSQESMRLLARRHGINPKTVAKWKKRESTADRRELCSGDQMRACRVIVGESPAIARTRVASGGARPFVTSSRDRLFHLRGHAERFPPCRSMR